MQPLANINCKNFVPATFRLKQKFDTKLKLVMINKHIKLEYMFKQSDPYRSSKCKISK